MSTEYRTPGSSLAAVRPAHGGKCPYCKEQIQPERSNASTADHSLQRRLNRFSGSDALTYTSLMQLSTPRHQSPLTWLRVQFSRKSAFASEYANG